MFAQSLWLRPLILFCIFLFSTCCTFATSENQLTPVISDEQLFKQSLQLYSQENYLESAKTLKVLLMKDNKKSIYWFNFANCLFMLKRYSSAIKYFDYVIKLNNKFVDAAKIYKAKSLIAIGHNTEAENLLTLVLTQSTSLASRNVAKVEIANIQNIFNIEDEAAEYYKNGNWLLAEERLKKADRSLLSTDALLLLSLAQLRQGKKKIAEYNLINLYKTKLLTQDEKNLIIELVKKSRSAESFDKPYNLLADVWGGQTNNVYVDGESLKLTSSGVNRINTAIGYHFLKDQPLSYKLNYNLLYEEPSAASELKLHNNTLAATLLYEKYQVKYFASPYVQIQNWSGVSALQKNGLQMQLSKQNTENEFGLEIDYAVKKSLHSDYDFLTGNEISIKPFYGQWNENIYGQVFFQFGSDNISDIQYADGSSLPLNQSYIGLGLKGIYSFEDKSLLSAYTVYTQRNYKNKVQPSDEKRSDQELALQIKYNYYFLPNFSVYATIDYTANNSTLGEFDVRDKNYKITVLGLGLTWDVFE